jgi:hypothetical protein
MLPLYMCNGGGAVVKLADSAAKTVSFIELCVDAYNHVCLI